MNTIDRDTTIGFDPGMLELGKEKESAKAPIQDRESTLELERYQNAFRPYIPSEAELPVDGEAQKFIEKCDNARLAIESELRLCEQKAAILQQFAVELEGSLFTRREAVAPFQNERDVLHALLEIYEDKQPYPKLMASGDLMENVPAEEREDLVAKNDAYFGKNTLVGRFWKTRRRQEAQRLANHQARQAIAVAIRERMRSVMSDLPQRTQMVRASYYTPGYKDFVDASAVELQHTQETLHASLSNLSAQRMDRDEASKFVEWLDGQLQSTATLNHEADGEDFLEACRDALEYLRQVIDAYEQELQKQYDHTLERFRSGQDLRTRLDQHLYEQRHSMDTLIKNCDAEKPGTWEMKEVWDTIRNYNATVKRAARFSCVSNGQEQFKNQLLIRSINGLPGGRHAQIARELSEDRSFFSHATKTQWMYDILESGHLASVKSQRSHRTTPRLLHRESWQAEREEHQICFQRDGLYSSFSSDETAAEFKVVSKIALLFDENDMLSQGNQFFDCDGIHVFDKNFHGDGESSPGFDLDLTREPVMIAVTKEEFPTFREFLIRQSAWRDQLESFSPDECEHWISDNVLVLDSLSHLREHKDEIHRRFQAKGLRARKGYVINTEHRNALKSGRLQRTMSFVPFASQNQEARII